ncbi:hypothetical protein TNCV_3596301 [Trichonephila clavipes]|nr:hypothetical protein TNCV_3596301 [Trichonephila clavipes]
MDSLVLNRLSLSDSRLRYGFSGVYSSDKLPKQRKRYRSFIVNTDPAHFKGRHWQAIYFRQDNHCVFSVHMEHDLTQMHDAIRSDIEAYKFLETFRSIFVVTLLLVRSNSLDAKLAVPNDPRYARLETNLGIRQAKKG